MFFFLAVLATITFGSISVEPLSADSHVALISLTWEPLHTCTMVITVISHVFIQQLSQKVCPGTRSQLCALKDNLWFQETQWPHPVWEDTQYTFLSAQSGARFTLLSDFFNTKHDESGKAEATHRHCVNDTRLKNNLIPQMRKKKMLEKRCVFSTTITYDKALHHYILYMSCTRTSVCTF